MIAFLIPLAAKIVGERFAKLASWGIVALAIGAALWGAYSWAYGQGVIAERAANEAEVAAIRKERDAAMVRATKTDAGIAEKGSAAITEKRKEIDDAIKGLPDKTLSDRQRARACAELRRTGRGCQPSAFTPASPR
jgi:hypothetical protein